MDYRVINESAWTGTAPRRIAIQPRSKGQMTSRGSFAIPRFAKIGSRKRTNGSNCEPHETGTKHPDLKKADKPFELALAKRRKEGLDSMVNRRTGGMTKAPGSNLDKDKREARSNEWVSHQRNLPMPELDAWVQGGVEFTKVIRQQR